MKWNRYSLFMQGFLITGMIFSAWMFRSASRAQPALHLKIDGSTSLYPVISVSHFQFPVIYQGTTFDVTATNSDHGQISILNGYVDIALSSTPCRPENQFLPTSGGFTTGEYLLSTTPSMYRCQQFEDHVVALDGIAIAANNARSCATILQKETILKIWQGGYPSPADFSHLPNPVLTYTWRDIFPECAGQPFENEVIVPLAPVIQSGTRVSLATLLGISTLRPNNGWPAEETTIAYFGAPRKTSVINMLVDVRENPNHIGYLPLAYLSGVHPLALDCASFAGPAGCMGSLLPSIENVQSGRYPLGRNLHLFSLPQKINPRQVIQDYLSWMRGPLGQAIVANVGYGIILPANQLPPNWDVNADHVTNINDVTILGAYWDQTGPADLQDPVYPTVRGWTRADINFDGAVNVMDISIFSANWNQRW